MYMYAYVLLWIEYPGISINSVVPRKHTFHYSLVSHSHSSDSLPYQLLILIYLDCLLCLIADTWQCGCEQQ